METEVIQTVLTELLDELKEVKLKQEEESKAILYLKETLIKVEQRMPEPEKYTLPITSIITNELTKLKTLIAAQPKSITREFRVLLFPEHNTIEYYRVVFGRLVFWMMMILIFTYLFVLGKDYIAENARTKQLALEANQYRKAWNHLYRDSKKSIRQKMDTAWVKVFK